MTGVTIDHLVALTLLLAVLMISIGAYSQIIGAAIIQQQNHQVAMKASDLANTILLSSGYPLNWGQGNSPPSAFGLQDPDVGGYSLSPFSLQRLSSQQSQVYYNKTGLWYSNTSLGGCSSLLVPLNNAVNYTTAAKLLGVNGTYGFQLTIMPTLNVSISEISWNPFLRLKVGVRGPGLALSGAALNYFFYHAILNPYADSPLIEALSGTSQTDSTGLAYLDFPTVTDQKFAYSIIVYASLSGLVGSGYYSHSTIADSAYIVPLIQNFEQGKVLLAHNWDINRPSRGQTAALHYNATFLILTKDFELRSVAIANSTGVLNNGEGKPFNQTQIPTSDLGILLVTYRKSANEYGIAMMPWGVSALGFSITFGGDPSNADWVATEIRQATVNGISYQVKLAVWNTKGRQIWRY